MNTTTDLPKLSSYPLRLSQYLTTSPSTSHLFLNEGSPLILEAIDSGRILVNGKLAREPNLLIYPDDEHEVLLAVSAESIPIKCTPPPASHAQNVYWIDKPKNSQIDLSILQDPLTITCKSLGPSFSPIGQLDINTTGLLLLTDSNYVQRLVNLPGHLQKVYRVYFEGASTSLGLTPAQIASLLTPTDITRVSDHSPVLTNFSSLTNLCKRSIVHNPQLPPNCTPRAVFSVDAVIASGQNHVVKRLFFKVKISVSELRRIRVGSMVLPGCDEESVVNETDVVVEKVVEREEITITNSADSGRQQSKKQRRTRSTKVLRLPTPPTPIPPPPIPTKLTDLQFSELMADLNYDVTLWKLKRCDLMCRLRQGYDESDERERLVRFLGVSAEEEKVRKCYSEFDGMNCRVAHE